MFRFTNFLAQCRIASMARSKSSSSGICEPFGGPVRKLAYEIKSVKWLPLREAIEALTCAHEKIFLANVGPIALRTMGQRLRREPFGRNQNKRGRRRASRIPIGLAAGN